MDCPVCGSKLEVVEEKTGKYKKGFSEFKLTATIFFCSKCNKKGVLRKVEDLGMESFEFPYEACD